MNKNIPFLETPRLILRGFNLADLDALHAILQDREVIRYIPRNEPWAVEFVQRLLDRIEAGWAEHGFGVWAVEERQKGELIGWCGLNYLEETNETEIEYLYRRSAWGRGLATEAAKFCVAYAFKEIKLDMLIGLVFPANIASQRVLEKCGLVYRNQAGYFGVQLLRYTIDRNAFAVLTAEHTQHNA
jgi:RimJ/RimL family protein N-acetyltransferase